MKKKMNKKYRWFFTFTFCPEPYSDNSIKNTVLMPLQPKYGILNRVTKVI